MKQHETGLTGEGLAEEYLTQRGMTCLDRRVRAGDGEIDLVMRDGGFIVFVEVKARPNARAGMGLAAVTPGKQRRMAHAAIEIMVAREWTMCPIRFDVVEITSDGVRHVPNAFMPGAWS